MKILLENALGGSIIYEADEKPIQPRKEYNLFKEMIVGNEKNGNDTGTDSCVKSIQEQMGREMQAFGDPEI